MRAFLAVELPDPARRAVVELVRRLRGRPGGEGVRWARPETLHVTLRFLGDDVAPEATGDLARRVGAEVAEIAPFELRLGPVRPFPSPRRPRVVALDVEPPEPLAGLAAAVERGVAAAGLPPEARPFRGHLTLGRLRGRRFPDASDLATPPTPIPVRGVVLFRSELGPDGARHTPLEQIPLGGDARESFTPETPEHR